MPLVSIVIPTYNRAELLAETLDSVLAQTYREFEVIVVDDGSQDYTQHAIATYGDRINYTYKKNGGQASARNVGIQLAHGEYIAFVDSDDLWHPEKLKQQMDLLLKGQYNWVYCDTELFQDKPEKIVGYYSQQHRPYHDQVAWHLLQDNFISSPTPVVKRNIFDEVGYFNESKELRSREDWEMWLRIAASYPIAYIPEPLARYRIHSGSETQHEDIQLLHQSQVQVLKQALLHAPTVYGPVREAAFTAQYIRTGRSLVGQGKIAEARNMFAQAIHSSPTQLQAYQFFLTTLLGQPIIRRLIAINRWRRNRQ